MRLRCGLVVAVCAAALAPPASADWLAPLPLSPQAQVGSHSAAIGPDGRLIAAWNDFTSSPPRIYVTMRAPGGPLEAPQPVSAVGASPMSPKTLIDDQGNALVMWEEGSVYRWAIRPVGATAFGPVGTVTLGTGERPFSELSLTAAPDGTLAAVGLTTQDSTSTSFVRVMTRAPGGDFVLHPAVDQVQSSMTVNATFEYPDIDADAQGGLYATWAKRVTASSTMTTNVSVAVRPPGAAAFGVENVASAVAVSGNATPEPFLSDATSGVDASGNLTVGFVQRRDDGGGSEVRLRSRPAGGVFAPGSIPVTTENQAGGPTDLFFDMNGAGTGVLAWAQGSGATASIEACVLAAGGPCGTAQPLTTGNVFAPVAAIGARGDIVVAWRRTSQAGDASFARTGSSFGAVHDLGSGSQVLVPREGIGVDALGDALVTVENAASGGSRQIRAFVNDSAPPSITRAAPASGQPGESLAFGASISDAWSTFSSVWDFGDGTTASGPTATHTYPAAGTFATTLTATDSVGNSATSVATVKIADTIAPVVLSFGMTNRTFAVGRRATPLSGASRRVRRGTTFRFNVTEGGSARITIQRARPGRRVRGRCRKPTRHNRSRPRCKRWVSVGALTRRVNAGKSRVSFTGRLRRKALGVRRYRAVLVASDKAKNKSKPRRVSFRVVHG